MNPVEYTDVEREADTREDALATAVEAPSTRDIGDDQLETVRAKLVEFEKRAAKVGVAPPRLEIVRTYEQPHPLPGVPGGVGWVEVRHVVVLHFEAIKLAGWTFVGTIDASDPGAARALLLAAPGQRIPEQYRDANPFACDHCRADRRRKKTYVVQHESGEHKQVGSGCLRDFLGVDPRAALAYLDLTASFDWGGEGGGWTEPSVWAMQTFLTGVVASVRMDGWLSNAAARARAEAGAPCATSTSTIVISMLSPTRDRQFQAEQVKFWRAVTETDKSKAVAMLDWVRAEFLTGSLDDYKYNLKAAYDSERVSRKTAGLVASAIVAYDRELSRRASAAARAERPSEYVGEVGKRIDIERATVLFRKDIESDWGVSTLLKFMAPSGDVFVWFASRAAGWIAMGDTVSLRATVKRHETRNGEKQTLLTRANVARAEGESTAA